MEFEWVGGCAAGRGIGRIWGVEGIQPSLTGLNFLSSYLRQSIRLQSVAGTATSISYASLSILS